MIALAIALVMSQQMGSNTLGDKLGRPQYHFTAHTGWLNDPNGLVFFKGEYHLFFQHNPYGTEWGNMTWGHAVSKDLVHWEQLDHALYPDTSGTMYSGSAVVDHRNTSGLGTLGQPPMVILYTAAGNQSSASKGQPFTQGLAYSLDGRQFTKLTSNPVLNHIEAENRDPKVVWHDLTKRWIMALYLNEDRYALFNSADLKHWERCDSVSMPGASECPDFFELPLKGDPKSRYWIFWSANGRYRLGRFDGTRFAPDTDPIDSNFGPNCYAAQTYSDAPKNRRIQIAWMQGGQYPGMPFNQQMTVPREITLIKTKEGPRLSIQPVAELSKLRSKTLINKRDLTVGELKVPCSTDLVEIRLRLTREQSLTIKFNGQEVRYDSKDHSISAFRRRVHLYGEEPLFDLVLYFDRTSLEVFADQGLVTIPGCFVGNTDSKELIITSDSGRALLKRLEVFELKSALPSSDSAKSPNNYQGGFLRKTRQS